MPYRILCKNCLEISKVEIKQIDDLHVLIICLNCGDYIIKHDVNDELENFIEQVREKIEKEKGKDNV